ncbi:MAG: hypothetical protein HRU20_07145 [Pseudomonadales bacterium]|nr:hypothetical protein [Pseudomonadales bacterium]
MIAFIVGLLMAAFMIASFRLLKTENTLWAYPLNLFFLPLIYVGFALYGNDANALKMELIVGLPFFIVAIICAFKGLKYSAYLMAAGWLLHGLFDAVHPLLIDNAGTPLWWPAFCGAVDIVIGFYLIVLARSLAQKALLMPASN